MSLLQKLKEEIEEEIPLFLFVSLLIAATTIMVVVGVVFYAFCLTLG